MPLAQPRHRPEWWNGRHDGLKIRCSQGREGSNPSSGTTMNDPGEIIVLNGAPRSGKSSIARVVQETFPGTWINLGVDVYMSATPAKLQPGIGLRPGGERPDLEPQIVLMYR